MADCLGLLIGWLERACFALRCENVFKANDGCGGAYFNGDFKPLAKCEKCPEWAWNKYKENKTK